MAAQYGTPKKKWRPWRAAVYGLVLALIVYSFLSQGFGDEDTASPTTLELAKAAGLIVAGPVVFLLIALFHNRLVQK